VRRVLVADDNLPSREILREVLEMSGYEVMEASDGEEAVQKAQRNKPDLMLLDIQMPRLDGFGVLKALRADPQLASLPVLALTAFAMQGDRERAMDAGFDGYITKPLDLTLLRQELRRFL